VPRLQELCASAGVIVLLIRELPKTHVCGATRWFSKDKALIQLSLRYKSDDQLWFTFFHEAGHIILHGKDLTFLEGNTEKNEFEAEADCFATDFLIPKGAFKEFIRTQMISISTIRRFAQEIGIAPGIVVGRLQHEEKISYKTQLNELKTFFRWVNG
jgi:Zn-dependent peptidase ImmA (M78 family)